MRPLSRPLLVLSLAAAACGSPSGPLPDDVDTDGDGIPDDPAPTCVTVALTTPSTGADAALLRVPLRRAPDAGPAGRFELRPVVITGTGEGAVSVDVEGPFVVTDAQGVALSWPVALSDADLPTTLLLGTDTVATGSLTLTPDRPEGVAESACPPVQLPLATQPWHDLAARSLPSHPWAQLIDLFRDDEQLQVALDPTLLDDRIGLSGEVYVVRHKSPAAWDEDPSLVNRADAVEQVTIGAPLSEGLVLAWSSDLTTGPGELRSFDIVVDLDGDHLLSPGDLIDGFGDRPGFWVSPDLSAPGPYTPQMQRASGGGNWRDEELWWPSDRPLTDPTMPLVIISHGNGHDYRWYGHLGAHLSSWGYVVMSHSNNTGPGIRAASTTTLDNTEWLVSNLDTVASGALAGRADPHRIVWVGHSRGGEGVVRAFQRLSGAAEPYAATVIVPDDIVAISSIAPTVFDGIRKANPGDRPYLLLAGGADGDVTGGADCAICQSMRIPAAASGPVSIAYVHGASHNVFHDGGGFDDGVGPDRLSRELVHPTMKALYVAWLGWQVLGEQGFSEVFTRMPADFRPHGVPDAVELALTWRDGISASALILDGFQTEPDIAVNAQGGEVLTDAVAVVEGVLDDGNATFTWNAGDVMNGMTVVQGDGFERGAILEWDGQASYTSAFAAAVDATPYRDLSMRVAQTTRHPNTVALDGPLAFAVELTDADGHSSLVEASLFGTVTAPYARSGLGNGVGWANEWNTVRVPLRAFVADGRELDLGRLTSVTLHFSAAHGATLGRIGLDDMYLAP